MLRELSPAEYQRGRLLFWLRRHRHRSILTERVNFERSLVTRLSHVEMWFDRTTRTLSEQVPDADTGAAANATGRWMAEACRAQLRDRNLAGHVGFFVPREWQTIISSSSDAAVDSRRPAIRRLMAHDGTVKLVAEPLQRRHQAPVLTLNTSRRLLAHDGTVTRVTVPTRHMDESRARFTHGSRALREGAAAALA
jgi:hypothetical protein